MRLEVALQTTYLAVIDVDFTVSDPSHRLHLLHESDRGAGKSTDHLPESLLRQFVAPELVLRDAPVQGAREFVRELLYHRQIVVVFCTARSVDVRPQTEQWLCENIGCRYTENMHWRLQMRDKDDRRPSAVVKSDKVRRLADAYEPLVWLDDCRQALTEASRMGFIPLEAPACYSKVKPAEVLKQIKRDPRPWE